MMEFHLLKKINSIEQEFHYINSKLEYSSTIDRLELQQLFKSSAEIKAIVDLFITWKKVSSDLTTTQQIVRESANDLELQKLATLELAELDRQIKEHHQRSNKELAIQILTAKLYSIEL